VIVNPPPIQVPFTIDQQGRLISPAWITWLQNLANLGQAEDVFSGVLTLQSTSEYTSHADPDGYGDMPQVVQQMVQQESSSTHNDRDDIFNLIQANSPTTITATTSTSSDEVMMFDWMSF